MHANSFFPLFLQLYVAQLLLAPVVLRSNWVCLWVGNTLYLSAVSSRRLNLYADGKEADVLYGGSLRNMFTLLVCSRFDHCVDHPLTLASLSYLIDLGYNGKHSKTTQRRNP